MSLYPAVDVFSIIIFPIFSPDILDLLRPKYPKKNFKKKYLAKKRKTNVR